MEEMSTLSVRLESGEGCRLHLLMIEALKNHIGVVTNENDELLKRLEAWEAFVRRILQLWKFNVNIEEIKRIYEQMINESWSRV